MSLEPKAGALESCATFARMARRRTLLATALGAGVALAATVGIADATTGVGTGLPQPKVLVAPDIGSQFVGKFVITSIDRRARISAGEADMDYTETPHPYIIGILTTSGYDSGGRQSTFIANLYPFSFTNQLLHAGILSQGSNKRIGALSLQLPVDPDILNGRITINGGTFEVALRRIDDDTDPTAALPLAKQTNGPPPKLKKAGLGASSKAEYGRYILQPATDDAGTDSGLYAPIVRIATALSTGQTVPDSGSLTLFGNMVTRGRPLVPSGIITLHQPNSTDVDYLTDWRWGGKYRTAVVRGGSTDGPAVGSFVGTLSGGTVSGTLTVGKQITAVTFKRQGK